MSWVGNEHQPHADEFSISCSGRSPLMVSCQRSWAEKLLPSRCQNVPFGCLRLCIIPSLTSLNIAINVVILLFQGTCTHGDKCCYSHDSKQTSEEKMEWMCLVIMFFFFFFLINFISGVWMQALCSLNQVRMMHCNQFVIVWGQQPKKC